MSGETEAPVPITREHLRAEGLAALLERTFLANLTREEQDAALGAMERRLYEPGALIIEIDAPGRGAELVATGRVEILQRAVAGGPLAPVARRGRGSLLGEYALVRDEPTTARVQAVTPVRTFHLPKRAFLELYERSPGFQSYIDGLMELRHEWLSLLDLLQEHPSLGLLDRDALEQLLQAGELRRLSPGEDLVTAGQAETDVFLVVEGRVGVYARGASGRGEDGMPHARGEELAFGRPGDIVGHVAVLLERPRTADVVAIEPSEVLRLHGPLFLQIVQDHASVHRLLMQEIARMDLRCAEGLTPADLRFLAVLVCGPARWELRCGLGYGVAAALREAGRVTIVDPNGRIVARRLGVEVEGATVGGRPVRRLRSPPDWDLRVVWPEQVEDAPPLLAALRDEAPASGLRHLAVVLAPASSSTCPGALEEAADVVVFARTVGQRCGVGERRGRRLLQAVHLSRAGSEQIESTRKAPVVRLVSEGRAVERFFETGRLAPLVSPAEDVGRACGRLVRLIRGRSVGLALGGGGAFGFAHAGLLFALEEEGFPIDFVSGVSSGALVGAVFVGGGTAALRRLVDRRERLFRHAICGWRTTDPIVDFVDELTGGLHLGGTELPFFAVGLDLTEGSEYVPPQGSLGEAVRASSCLPGFWVPHREGHLHLVDGGVVNNVPASVVWNAGADFIIGSNVIPPHPRELRHPLARWGPARPVASALSRMDDLLRSMYRLMSQAGRDRARLADFVFQPAVEDFDAYDFRRGDEITDAGLGEARRLMRRIRDCYRRESMIRF